jgi:hypothetical protein
MAHDAESALAQGLDDDAVPFVDQPHVMAFEGVQLLAQLGEIGAHRHFPQPCIDAGEVELVQLPQLGALRVHLVHPGHQVLRRLITQRLLELAGQSGRDRHGRSSVPRVPSNLKLGPDGIGSNSRGRRLRRQGCPDGAARRLQTGI